MTMAIAPLLQMLVDRCEITVYIHGYLFEAQANLLLERSSLARRRSIVAKIASKAQAKRRRRLINVIVPVVAELACCNYKGSAKAGIPPGLSQSVCSVDLRVHLCSVRVRPTGRLSSRKRPDRRPTARI